MKKIRYILGTSFIGALLPLIICLLTLVTYDFVNPYNSEFSEYYFNTVAGFNNFETFLLLLIVLVPISSTFFVENKTIRAVSSTIILITGGFFLYKMIDLIIKFNKLNEQLAVPDSYMLREGGYIGFIVAGILLICGIISFVFLIDFKKRKLKNN